MIVHISPSNGKMGPIPSVSLPAGETCRKDAPCYQKCYARRLEAFRTTVHDSYVDNLAVLIQDPSVYWREVEASIMMSRYFRFHVAGDIPDPDYLERMMYVTNRNQHCDVLCFSKQYEIGDDYLRRHEKSDPIGLGVPKNMHFVYSVWKGLECPNPYRMPEAHILYKDGTTTARPDAIPCGGNCTDCAKHEGGCWKLKRGDQLVIKEH